MLVPHGPDFGLAGGELRADLVAPGDGALVLLLGLLLGGRQRGLVLKLARAFAVGPAMQPGAHAADQGGGGKDGGHVHHFLSSGNVVAKRSAAEIAAISTRA